MKKELPVLSRQNYARLVTNLLTKKKYFKKSGGNSKFGLVQQGILALCFFLLLAPVTYAQEDLIGLTSNGGPEGKGTLFSIKTTGANFSVLKGFADWGKTPYGGLVRGNDGYLYGMTFEGGTYNYGTIFKVSTSGSVTMVHQFDYTTTGAYPRGSLIKGADGTLYGMTGSGGPNGYGTIFKISAAGTLTVIKIFSVNTEGGRPSGELVIGKDGNFYGLNYSGGTNGYGTIFKMTPGGTYTVLHTFNYNTDGGHSHGSLVQAKDGNFYGTTYWGGTYGYGTIFKISSTGSFKVVRHLQTTDGIYPKGSLVAAADGNLYGMAARGGANSVGTIFKVTTAGGFAVINNLQYKEAGYPLGSLVQGTDGALYGMANYGGTHGFGSIFKVTTKGVLTVLRSLDDINDGSYPNGGLFQNTDGNFYGLTSQGGKNFFGTIFKITPNGTFTVLNSLNGASKGNAPHETLIAGKDGAYYGTTSAGGAYRNGTIFKLCGSNLTVLRTLNKNADGAFPLGSLVQATDGNFYGMTSEGGMYTGGTIFRITPGGTYTVLRHLNIQDGIYPYGSLIQGKDGALYGLTRSSGKNSGGTIFKINLNGSNFTILRHLTVSSDGGYPEGSLVQATDGNLYGVTSYGGTNYYGTIFKISTTGTFSVLRNLNSISDGSSVVSGLVLGKDGNLYGTASSGGNSYYGGTIFKITTKGTFSVIKHFTPDTDGSAPKGNLVQASDGNFYGLTSRAGKYNSGTVFRITPAGSYKVLRHLNLETDGGNPLGGLLVQKSNPLVANAQSVTTSEDTQKAITLTGTGGLPLVYTIVAGPKNGTLSGSGTSRTYKPNANFNGKDSFTFTVSVGCQTSAQATVSITVNSTNDAPVLAAISNKTALKGDLVSFTAKATDPDAGQSRTFSLISAPSGATIGGTSGIFNWRTSAAGTFNFTVKVTDNGSPALSDQQQVTVTVTNPGTASTVRLNSGGNAVATTLGNFAADAYTTGSSEITTNAVAIDGTTNDKLYQDYRKAAITGGSFGYSIPVTNGTYTVKLHFAELFHTTTGKRKFNVAVEESSWLSNYDILAVAGNYRKAVVASKTIVVSDGTLNLNFTSVVDKAIVAAIEVIPATASGIASASETENSDNSHLVTNLYPNPAESYLNVTLQPEVTNLTARITDYTGTIMQTVDETVTDNKLVINVANLKPGLYQLQVQTTSGVQVYRFVKK